MSYNKIGDVLVAQGNLPEALKSFRDGHDILKRLAREEKYCVVVVTHNLAIAEASDVVYRMSDGTEINFQKNQNVVN